MGKGNGKQSFPKGGLNRRSDGSWETVFQGALREWREETGIAAGRLKILEGAYADDASVGCRLLVATCEAAAGQQPDEGRLEWKPPLEDTTDKDPIVLAFWMSVRQVLAGKSRLLRGRVVCLESALQKLAAGGTFVLSSGSHVASLASLPGTDKAPSAPALAVANEAPSAPSLSSTEKEVLKVAKKMREILKLEQNLGAVKDKGQLNKIAKKAQFLQELGRLLSNLPEESVARAIVADITNASAASVSASVGS